MTTVDDREPRSLDEEVVVGLYHLNEDGDWEQIGYQDFPYVSSVIGMSDAELELVIVHALSLDEARQLLIDEFDDWEQAGGEGALHPWMKEILKDAGVDLEAAGTDGALREAVEQILNASPAQILGYMDVRTESIHS